MILDKELLINSLLLLFKSKAKNGHVPKIISGKEIYEHYNFHNTENTLKDRSAVEEDNYFFNILCYGKPQVLKVNPGMSISSANWIDNNYGLREPYLTQIIREYKIDSLLN